MVETLLRAGETSPVMEQVWPRSLATVSALASGRFHVGIDNANVVRTHEALRLGFLRLHIQPWQLRSSGDLLSLCQKIAEEREVNNVALFKAKAHAKEQDVD